MEFNKTVFGTKSLIIQFYSEIEPYFLTSCVVILYIINIRWEGESKVAVQAEAGLTLVLHKLFHIVTKSYSFHNFTFDIICI